MPLDSAQLGSLVQLGLGGNALAGTVPAALGALTQLQMLGLGYNRLTGSLPPSLSQLTRLRYFVSYCNPLTGALPALPFAGISICEASWDGSLGRNCSDVGDYRHNAFACPLPAGAAEHCHAKCH